MLTLAWGWACAQTIYRLTDLGTLSGGPGSSGSAINASGQVTGLAFMIDSAGLRASHAFLWDGSTMRDLGTLGEGKCEFERCDSAGYAINDSGQVTGFAASTTVDTEHAFFWDGTTLQDLGTLGGTLFSQGNAINASGQVTGEAALTGDKAIHAFLWDGTRMRDLGTLGGLHSEGAAINDSGQVTGNADTTGNAARHAFLWDGATMRDLGTLGGKSSGGNAINDSGQVTGSAALTGDKAFHAFLWDGTRMRDLNDLIDPADPLRSFVTLTSGVDINDRGQILTNEVDRRTGQQHAYLVSPVTADTTPPLITPVVTGTLGGKGWYRSTVTVTWEVTDVQSPISATAGCRQTVVFTDTPGKTITCVARSNGGKKSKSVTIKRDTTSPAVVIGAPVDGRTYHTHQQVAAVYACADQTSGIKQCAGPVSTGASIDTASAGTKSFTVKVLDMAGNVGSRTVHYQVVN
jgi:probable HAF family extracellular repeat protein